MKSGLFCGAGKALITPPADLLPKLRGVADYNFTAVADDLYVRAIIVKNADNALMFVDLDLPKAMYPGEIVPELAARTGIPEENIFYFATHTHTAPSVNVSREGGNQARRVPEEVAEATAEYEKFAEERLWEAVDQAVGSVRPARMGYAYGESFINVNRNQRYHVCDENGVVRDIVGLGVNPEGPVDHTLFVMKFTDMEDSPIAFLVNYPMHNCLMIWNNFDSGKVAVSGDVGGNVSQWMEKRYEGAVAVWCSGAAGDINPQMMNQIYYPCPVTGQQREYYVKSFEPASVMLRVLASRHYDDIKRTLSKIDSMTCGSDLKGGAFEWSETPGRDVLRQPDGSVRIVTGEGVKPATVRLHGFRFGDILFIGINGELYSSLGRAVQEASPLKNAVIITHDCTMAGGSYIFDDGTLTAEQAECPGPVPALANTRFLPGYLEDSLRRHTADMAEKLL